MLTERQISDQVLEALSGIASERRAAARAAGERSARAVVALADFHGRVERRFAAIGEDASAPTVDALREKWLPEILTGADYVTFADDVITMEIMVPPPRKAHAK